MADWFDLGRSQGSDRARDKKLAQNPIKRRANKKGAARFEPRDASGPFWWAGRSLFLLARDGWLTRAKIATASRANSLAVSKESMASESLSSAQ